jgi:hypothetical protein
MTLRRTPIKVICSSVTAHFRRTASHVPPIDQIANRYPRESADQSGETFLAAMQVDALAKPIGGLYAGDARLPGIDLPGVDVKDVGHPRAQDRAYALTPQRIGDEPEIAAPTPRYPPFAEPDTRHARFMETIAE